MGRRRTKLEIELFKRSAALAASCDADALKIEVMLANGQEIEAFRAFAQYVLNVPADHDEDQTACCYDYCAKCLTEYEIEDVAALLLGEIVSLSDAVFARTGARPKPHSPQAVAPTE